MNTMAAIKNKILIVDPNIAYSEQLRKYLESFGFWIDTMASGTGALNAVDTQQPAMVLLEYALPDMPGFDVLSEIKRNQFTRNIPVIIHTEKSDQIDKIVGLELGAEDYITKPCDPRELLLRIKRAVNRIASQVQFHDEIRVGQLSVSQSKALVIAAGRSVRLSAMELKLLVVLMERCGRLQSRERLLADLWGYNVSAKSRTLDTHIKRLRDKLGDVVGSYIETIRNIGFRMKEAQQEDVLPLTSLEEAIRPSQKAAQVGGKRRVRPTTRVMQVA